MTIRKQQVESVLKRAISQVLARQISDPRISGMVSVTHVDVSPDLHEAFVYVSVLPERHEKRTLYGLRHAAGYIQSLVIRSVKMRQVPNLEFRLDSSLKKQAEVLDAIRRGMEKQSEAPAAAEGETSPDPAVETQPSDPEDSAK